MNIILWDEYRRRFQHGTVYCNPTKSAQTVDGHYLAAEDGAIL